MFSFFVLLSFSLSLFFFFVFFSSGASSL